MTADEARDLQMNGEKLGEKNEMDQAFRKAVEHIENDIRNVCTSCQGSKYHNDIGYAIHVGDPDPTEGIVECPVHDFSSKYGTGPIRQYFEERGFKTRFEDFFSEKDSLVIEWEYE